MPTSRDPVQTEAPQAAGLRARIGTGVFSDSNLRQVAHVLDDLFAVPGTRFRFGLDGLVGLVPIAGDVLGGVLSGFLLIGAWARGAPPVLLLRMLVNIGIDVIVGTIPLLGDAFDIAWKANRRNYALLERHLLDPGRHGWRDWAFLGLLLGALLLLLALPLVLLGFLLALLVHR